MFDLQAFLAMVVSPILGGWVVFNAWRSPHRVPTAGSLFLPALVLGVSLISWAVVLWASVSQWGLWATAVFLFAAFGSPWLTALSSRKLGPSRESSVAHRWLFRSSILFSGLVFSATLARGIYERVR